MRWFHTLGEVVRRRNLPAALLLTLATAAFVVSLPGAARGAPGASSKGFWQVLSQTPPPDRQGAKPVVKPAKFTRLKLNRGAMESYLARAPRERTKPAREEPLVVELPTPTGESERFALEESPVIEPGLAAGHPEIHTYRGRGIDDPTATLRISMTPLGFNASVRSPRGAWYIDPYYHLDQSLYASYYGREVKDSPHGVYVERESGAPDLATDRSYYRVGDTVVLSGGGFAAGAGVAITISSPGGALASRSLSAIADAHGGFQLSFTTDPNGDLGTHQVDAEAGEDTATFSYEVVGDDDASVDPPVGDELRTFRLALLSDPSYATFFGGPANVTAAKAVLMNRVDQIYEDETSIRMLLVANNDNANLNTAADATGANGPCGAAACFTAAQLASCGSGTLTRNRIVLGQLIGASNYDIGHVALGVRGGGLASVGVVGRSAKAQGCTGLAAPVGDSYAVDYVAHEMGHQFAGRHTFNGTNSNCSGGNRNAATSVEPGSGSSIMAYAGICSADDDLQPHSDPYWSQRSQQEISTYVASNQDAIDEVETVSLRNYNTDGDSFRIVYNGQQSAPIVRGTNYTTAGIAAAIQDIPGWSGGTVAVAAFGGSGTLNDSGFEVTFDTAPLAGTNVSDLSLTAFSGADDPSGFVGETDKGGAVDNNGNTITPTGNNYPVVTAPGQFTIPLRTPFALTGSATDADRDTLTYMWEQNDRGGTAGTALTNNTKTDGPLFRQFGTALQQPPYDPVQYNSPGENAVDTDPTRVFPDMAQILANNTNAETGTCPAGNIECFSEFLPTSAYVGLTEVNASPLSLHFRLTARDGRGGVNSNGTDETTLLLATNAGPFLVTAPNAAVTWKGGSTQTITWDPANTDIAPVSAANVKISLSTDGGLTYPHVLAASTPNDGSEPVTLPDVTTTQARIKVEAVGNVFFDVSNANFAIQAAPSVSNSLGAGGSRNVQYSDSLSPDVTITATDADTAGSSLSASAAGLPAGMSLAVVSTSTGSTLPGSRTWKVAGATTAAPGVYPVTVTISDGDGNPGTTSFTIVVTREDADTTYTGDMLAFTTSGGSTANVLLRATVRDSSLYTTDSQPGDIRNATVTFKEGSTTLCGSLAVTLINGATTTGTASCTTTLSLGAHTIDIYVNGYYMGSGAGVVEVAQPDGSFVTGGGYRILDKSAGTYKAGAGSRMSFGFIVNYRNTKNLQGHVNVIYQAGDRTYQIKSTAIDSLGVVRRTSAGASCTANVSSTCWGLADFRSKANLIDVTNPLAPVSIAGSLSLQVTMTDKGEPGSSDTIGVTLYNRDTLVFSSEWNGTKTAEGLLAGGNLVVH
jgi:hypothetical protein